MFVFSWCRGHSVSSCGLNVARGRWCALYRSPCLSKAGLVAQKHLQKELKMDAKQLDKELAQASKDMQNQARTDTY